MYKQVLESISGVEIYPIIALIMFFFMFVVILMWIFLIDKKTITRMSNIPLDDTENINTRGGLK
ncbi:MAG: CcoQ/FixQ family Cbb3-type cytochrome c oxidase assembly chaperone [Ignavibacteria bacterium]|nr:CcoQ/FixQ family Cbb3-type cytochrome c oxidase assembly chaperone [Ignavibacteria bacterium]